MLALWGWDIIRAKREFASWVPNVTGHLSFSAVGHQLPGDAACYNNLNSATLPPDLLFVAAAQRRRNGDSSLFLRVMARLLAPLRPFLTRYDTGPFAEFARDWLPEGHAQHFFIVSKPVGASTPYFDREGKLANRWDDRGALQGSVFILAEETQRPHRQEQRNQLAGLRDSIEVLNSSAHPDPISNAITLLRGDIERMADHQVDFILYRTGECRLQVKNAENVTPKGEEWLARHAYFFIRDAAHRHYHHSSRDDRLLPTVEVRLNDELDDLSWRREVLWALTRTIGEYRRSRSMAQRRQALGITAYADAFQRLLARITRGPGEPGTYVEEKSLATFDFAHLRESAKVGNEVSAWRRQGGFSVSALAIATCVSMTALWVAATRLAQEKEWKPATNFFTAVVKVFYSLPEVALLVAGGIIFIVWDATYSERPFSDRLFKTFLGISSPRMSYGKRAKARVYLISFLLFLMIAALIDFQFQVWLFR